MGPDGMPQLSPEMMEQMQTPEMMAMAKDMMKNMDPDALASMMKQSGIDVSPEQAGAMKQQVPPATCLLYLSIPVRHNIVAYFDPRLCNSGHSQAFELRPSTRVHALKELSHMHALPVDYAYEANVHSGGTPSLEMFTLVIISQL
jgi:hypothetical protein